MATSIDIASNALLLIGDDPINALSDSVAAANLYDQTYQYVLSEHPWSFALKEQFFSRLTQTPDRLTGYQFAYQRPTDLIRLWAVFPTTPYIMMGDFVYSNASSMLGRYVYKVDETSLPPHFVKAIEYKLAAEFSIAVAEDEQKAQIFENKYLQSLRKAMGVDSQQAPFEGIQRNPIRLTRSRR